MDDSCLAVGLDIGGANVKCSAVRVFAGGDFKVVYGTVRGFSLDVGGIVGKVAREAGGADVVGVTSTAEYGLRQFRTLADGIRHYRDELASLGAPSYWVTLDGRMVGNDSVGDAYEVAAANWVASALHVGRYVAPDCIFIDAGSTTCDIIPVLGGRPAASGRFDFQRLGSGELVYTGAVNTSVGSIVRRLRVDGSDACVSTESFSISGDVHLILGNISRLTFRSYCQGVDPDECYTRLAHMVCADDRLLQRGTLDDMAGQVWGKQVRDVADGLSQVWGSCKGMFGGRPPVVLSGLGARFIGAKAAALCGFTDVVNAEEAGGGFVNSLPAVASGVLAGRKFLGDLDG